MPHKDWCGKYQCSECPDSATCEVDAGCSCSPSCYNLTEDGNHIVECLRCRKDLLQDCIDAVQKYLQDEFDECEEIDEKYDDLTNVVIGYTCVTDIYDNVKYEIKAYCDIEKLKWWNERTENGKTVIGKVCEYETVEEFIDDFSYMTVDDVCMGEE